MQILVLGAGRSAGWLIDYLANYCNSKHINLLVVDKDFSGLWDAFEKKSTCNYIVGDVSNEEFLRGMIQESTVVVSLLPPIMHVQVAKLCIELKTNLVTASYTSPEMKALHNEAVNAGIVLLNEMGLDPGIDHISASLLLQNLQNKKAKVNSFESYCGGLISQDDCQDNPWKYKFTWNPRNVVLAGQGGQSIWRKNGDRHAVEPEELFNHAINLDIPGVGTFDAYPNRDSLGYEKTYLLEDSDTIIRGTLRRSGFCEAWQVLIQAGFTDNVIPLPAVLKSVKSWFEYKTGFSKVGDWMNSLDLNENTAQKMAFLDFDGAMEISDSCKTSADVLEQILLTKWKLEPSDKDEIVMYHRIGFTENTVSKVSHSVLVVLGDGGGRTAMAKTVGYPLAIGVELILEGIIDNKGVAIPIYQSWNQILMQKLEDLGIVFRDFVE
jgi:saccharopine dehydrogenase-like NADP-dependent oxidoreductase